MYSYTTFLVIAIFVITHTAQGHHGFSYNIPGKPRPENSDSTIRSSVPDLYPTNIHLHPLQYFKFNTLFEPKQPASKRSTELMEAQNSSQVEASNDNMEQLKMTLSTDNMKQQQLSSEEMMKPIEMVTQLPQVTTSSMQVDQNKDTMSQAPGKVEENNENNQNGGPDMNDPYKGDISAIPGQPDVDYPIYSKIPSTTFRCDKQQWPGYYADVESKCQVFHVCFKNLMYDFLCPNGTIFHQKHLVCVWWHQFDCKLAPSLYETNANLYKEVIKKAHKSTENLRETKPYQLETTTISTNQTMNKKHEITTENTRITNTNYEYKNMVNTESPQMTNRFLRTVVFKPSTPKQFHQMFFMPVSNYLIDEGYPRPTIKYTKIYNQKLSNEVNTHLDSKRYQKVVFQNALYN